MLFTQDELERMKRKIDCPICEGKGQIVSIIHSLTGTGKPTYVCDKCDGTGKIMQMQLKYVKAQILDL